MPAAHIALQHQRVSEICSKSGCRSRKMSRKRQIFAAALILFTIDQRECASKAEIVAEIKATDIRIGNDVIGPSVRQHLAGVDDVGAVDKA